MQLRQDFPFVGQVAEAKRYLLRNGVDVLPRAGHYFRNATIYRNRTRPGPAWVAIVPVFEPPPAVSETRAVLCYRRAASAWEPPVCGTSAPREPGYRYQVFKSAAIESTRAPEALGNLLSSVTTELGTDEWGNTTRQSCARVDAARLRNTSRPPTSACGPSAACCEAQCARGRPRAIARSAPGDESTRTAAFEYYADGQVKREVVEPENSASCVRPSTSTTASAMPPAKSRATATARGFSSGKSRGSGALRRGALRGACGHNALRGGQSRVRRRDPRWEAGRFPTATSNALGHTEHVGSIRAPGTSFALPAPTGSPRASSTTSLGASSSNGRPIRAGEPLRRVGSMRRATTPSTWSRPPGARIRADGRALAPPSWTYFDSLGREVLRSYPNFAGETGSTPGGSIATHLGVSCAPTSRSSAVARPTHASPRRTTTSTAAPGARSRPRASPASLSPPPPLPAAVDHHGK